MNLDFKFDDLDDFYRECEIVEETGNRSRWGELTNKVYSHFTGLSKDKILEYKYSYQPGIENLGDIESTFNIGSSNFTHKWDDQDGEEMSMERAYEGMPFLKKRIRKVGNNSGKFVTININLSEPGMVGYKQMQYKAKTAAELINKLSGMGYSIAVRVLDVATNCGTFNGERVKKLTLSVPVKKFDEPLNMSLLLACISPWFMRYWMFRFECAKVNMNIGMGGAGKYHKSEEINDIYIECGECLDKESSKQKVEELSKKFDEDFKDKEVV